MGCRMPSGKPNKGTDGKLIIINRNTDYSLAALRKECYVSHGLFLKHNLFNAQFCETIGQDAVDKIVFGEQHDYVCHTQAAFALLALNPGLLELLPWAGASTAALTSAQKPMLDMQQCLYAASSVDCLPPNAAYAVEQLPDIFERLVASSLRDGTGKDSKFYSSNDMHDGLQLLYDVLLLLSGRLRQERCAVGEGATRIGMDSQQKMREVFYTCDGQSPPWVYLYLYEAFLLSELACMPAQFLVQARQVAVCPDNVQMAMETVFEHLMSWVAGNANSVPLEVSECLQLLVDGWPFSWVLESLVCMCGYKRVSTGAKNVWVCGDQSKYNENERGVATLIVSVYEATQQILCNTAPIIQVRMPAAEGGAEPATTAAMGSSNKSSGKSGGSDAERNKSREAGMLDSVLEARNLIFEASFYPMCHDDVQKVMKHSVVVVDGVNPRLHTLQGFIEREKAMPMPEGFVAGVELAKDSLSKNRAHLAIESSRIDKSISFMPSLPCSDTYKLVSTALTHQFKHPTVPLVDGKHLFESDVCDGGYLYIGMGCLHAAPQAVLAGMVAADDKAPEENALSSEYRAKFHAAVRDMLADKGDTDLDEDELATVLLDELKERSDKDTRTDEYAVSVKTQLNLETFNDSNEVPMVVAALMEQRTAVLEADAHGTDAFGQAYQLDDCQPSWHKQDDGSFGAELHVAGVLRSGMEGPEHRIVLLQQCVNADGEQVSIIRTAPWDQLTGTTKSTPITIRSDSLGLAAGAGTGDGSMGIVRRLMNTEWHTQHRVLETKLDALSAKQKSNLLKQHLPGGGLWLEHRTKGPISSATRTYWWLSQEALHARLDSIAGGPASGTKPAKPDNSSDGNEFPCKHADEGCVATFANKHAASAHLRHCAYHKAIRAEKTPSKKKTKSAAKVVAGGKLVKPTKTVAAAATKPVAAPASQGKKSRRLSKLKGARSESEGDSSPDGIGSHRSSGALEGGDPMCLEQVGT